MAAARCELGGGQTGVTAPSCHPARPRRLQTASFTAPRITVRPGIGSLLQLRDLRFRSAKKPLHFSAASAAASPGRSPGGPPPPGAPLLPSQLLKLRLEGCHLTEVGL